MGASGKTNVFLKMLAFVLESTLQPTPLCGSVSPQANPLHTERDRDRENYTTMPVLLDFTQISVVTTKPPNQIFHVSMEVTWPNVETKSLSFRG